MRMGDGPVANLPDGLEAYAGYIDDGGDGITFPGILARFPNAKHLSISVHGAQAMCGDVEKGALANWIGYDYGYCNLANANQYITTFGRPKKLWIAHHNNTPHICDPSCGFGFRDFADGTQWIDHGGLWDESLLKDDFFVIDGKEMQVSFQISIDGKVIIGKAVDNGNVLCMHTEDYVNWDVTDVALAATAAAHKNNPADNRTYNLQ